MYVYGVCAFIIVIVVMFGMCVVNIFKCVFFSQSG